MACGGTAPDSSAMTSRQTRGSARMSRVWADSPLTWVTNRSRGGAPVTSVA